VGAGGRSVQEPEVKGIERSEGEVNNQKYVMRFSEEKKTFISG